MGKVTQTYTVEGSVDRGKSIQVVPIIAAIVFFLSSEESKRDFIRTKLLEYREKAS